MGGPETGPGPGPGPGTPEVTVLAPGQRLLTELSERLQIRVIEVTRAENPIRYAHASVKLERTESWAGWATGESKTMSGVLVP